MRGLYVVVLGIKPIIYVTKGLSTSKNSSSAKNKQAPDALFIRPPLPLLDYSTLKI